MIKYIWKKLKRILLIAFVTSFVYLLLCKWIMPPITITQINSLIAGDGLKRDYVNWNDISVNIKLAAIAGEDQLFPDHNGFDWDAINKSLNPKPGKSTRIAGAGASTISQQTAKNVFLWQGDGITRYIRKIPEAYFTLLIEWVWGKERILEVYLNTIEMGRGIYGVEAASRYYFNTSAKNLSGSQAAQIIATLPNPKLYTIKPMSRFVNWKYKWILRQMKNIGGDADVRKIVYYKK